MVALVSPPTSLCHPRPSCFTAVGPADALHKRRGRHLRLVPAPRPVLATVDDLIDTIRWGGSAALRLAIVSIALVIAVLSVRLAQGVPPADAGTQFNSSATAGSSAGSGDIVLNFSASG